MKKKWSSKNVETKSQKNCSARKSGSHSLKEKAHAVQFSWLTKIFPWLMNKNDDVRHGSFFFLAVSVDNRSAEHAFSKIASVLTLYLRPKN